MKGSAHQKLGIDKHLAFFLPTTAFLLPFRQNLSGVYRGAIGILSEWDRENPDQLLIRSRFQIDVWQKQARSWSELGRYKTTKKSERRN